jgi:hypothetical protein
VTNTGEKRLVLGAEYDDQLLEALRDVLRGLGAKSIAKKEFIAGSQEVTTQTVVITSDGTW